MKPKLGVIFPQITDSEIAEIVIEKISVSKNKRKIKITLPEGTSEYTASLVRSEVKRAGGFTDVLTAVTDGGGTIDRNVMIYTVPKEEQNGSGAVKYRGKADVFNMLYGRPIKGNIVAISSLNSVSGQVIISGRVLFAEEREMVSKKTGKEFHLITAHMTDVHKTFRRAQKRRKERRRVRRHKR